MHKDSKNINGNIKEVRGFLIIITLGILGLSLALNFSIIYNGKAYSNIAKVLMLTTIMCAILNIILGMFDSIITQVTYIGGTILGNLTILSLYIVSLGFLSINNPIGKVIVILNFIVIELVLFLRRVIFKDNNYINSIKQGKHNSYVKKDILLALVISFILISLSIFLDSHFHLESFENIIIGIGGLILSNLGIAIYVTSIANYMYVIKPKNQSKIYNVPEHKK